VPEGVPSGVFVEQAFAAKSAASAALTRNNLLFTIHKMEAAPRFLAFNAGRRKIFAAQTLRRLASIGRRS
jgi:hypothetical protein